GETMHGVGDGALDADCGEEEEVGHVGAPLAALPIDRSHALQATFRAAIPRESGGSTWPGPKGPIAGGIWALGLACRAQPKGRRVGTVGGSEVRVDPVDVV